MTTKVLINACRKNDTILIQDILTNDISIDIESPYSDTFTKMCKYINKNALKWVIEKFPNINIKYNDNQCLEILWKRDKSLFDIIVKKYWTTSQLLLWASLRNNLEICKHINETSNINSNTIPYIFISNILLECIRLNNVETLLYLVDRFEKNHDLGCILLIKSLKYNNFDLANTIYNKYLLDNFEMYSSHILKEVCKIGNILSLEWLLKKSSIISNTDNIEDCILNAISSDSLDIFNWLLNSNETNINKFLYTRHCIINDSIKIFEYLFNKYSIDVTVYTFNDMCAYGSKNILEYTFRENILDNIDIEKINSGFYIAGINEKHIIMRFLLEKNADIDIGINDNVVFKKACQNNNSDIAKIFTETRPEIYQIVYENGDITSYMIKQKIKSKGSKDVDNTENCAICLHKQSEIITDCNHQFCEECINNWHMLKENCPYCRKNNIDFFEINRD